MHPLLMDAVVTARQDELRRAARHTATGGRRPSRLRAALRHPLSPAARSVGEPASR